MNFDAVSYELGRLNGNGGGSANIEAITITENGTTYATSSIDGYAPVVVAVPAPAINLQNKTVQANGTYTADQGYDGLGQVVVNVAGGQSMYDLTGNIDGVFASPQATEWFGTNYAYINSISNITSMKAAFQGVSAYPNKSITLATAGADCQGAFKNASLSSLPSISGKIIAADDMFEGANITTIDLRNTTYDPDYTKDVYESSDIFKNANSIDTIYMPAEYATYSFAHMFRSGNIKHIIDVFNSQEQTIYTRKTPSPGWSGGFQCRAFEGASYLRELPAGLVSALGTMPWDGADDNSMYCGMCQNCNDLDAIELLPVVDLTMSGSDPFGWIVAECNHLSRFTFETINGTVNWTGYTLDLTRSVGYGYWQHLPAEKEITDAASYALLKNDPDAWTKDVNYSRYNHNSAVETINSLPELESGNTCAVSFVGDAGALTDAGAISTLTSAEIAVASAKGWTISLA